MCMCSPVKGYPIFFSVLHLYFWCWGTGNNRKMEIDVVENRVKVQLQQAGEWEKTWKD